MQPTTNVSTATLRGNLGFMDKGKQKIRRLTRNQLNFEKLTLLPHTNTPVLQLIRSKCRDLQEQNIQKLLTQPNYRQNFQHQNRKINLTRVLKITRRIIRKKHLVLAPLNSH